MLVEIHIIQNHAPSNLNRDDTGSPKECMFGGVKRARISSQCLKRSIRRSDLFMAELAGHLAYRTRRLPELVKERLIQGGMAVDMAAVAGQKATGFGTKDGKERESDDTAQTMFLTDNDVAAVADALRDAATAAKTAAKFAEVKAGEIQASAQQKGFRPITVDIALFGRMTTSGAFRDVEASTQVAHAISTHKVDHEFDYFTAVDDLQGKGDVEEDAGADMLGDVEYNSACYYKYFSVDVTGLQQNLTGENGVRSSASADEKAAALKLAAKAVDALIRSAAMTTPTGKQNSFAAHQLPAAILVEVRPTRTPVSYANAFVKPVTRDAEGLVVASLKSLGQHVEALTSGFNLAANERLLLAPEHTSFQVAGITRVANLNDLCSRLQEAVARG